MSASSGISKLFKIDFMSQKYGVPALFSFLIPGLGQLVKKHFIKAVFIYIIFILDFCVICAELYVNVHMSAIKVLFIPVLIYIVTRFWNIIDAYNSDKDFFRKEV